MRLIMQINEMDIFTGSSQSIIAEADRLKIMNPEWRFRFRGVLPTEQKEPKSLRKFLTSLQIRKYRIA